MNLFRIWWSNRITHLLIDKPFIRFHYKNTLNILRIIQQQQKSCHSTLFSITTMRRWEKKKLWIGFDKYNKLLRTNVQYLMMLSSQIDYWICEYIILLISRGFSSFFYYCDENKFLSLKIGWNYIFRLKFNIICREAKKSGK